MLGLSLTALEWLALGAALAIALAAPQVVLAAGSRVLEALARLAEKPTRAVAVFASAAGVGAFLCSALVQWPTPRVHDEYSYLLAADTFASGRLANPSPPCAQQLESFHVITQPVYASKYPSGQGLALALGQALAGEPALSLWLMAALFVGSTTWLLIAVLPPRWAAVGACIALLKIGATTYWAQSYWGGCLTAAGGALAFGALVRIVRGGRFALGATMGCGVALLGLTRPFEGAVACVPLGLVFAGWALRSARAGETATVLRVAAGAALPIGAALAWTALVNRAVTGDPLQMPYFLHDAAYAVAPPFLWQGARPTPSYATVEIGEFWTGFAYDAWARQRTFDGWLELAPQKLRTWWTFYIGAALTPALIAASFAVRGRALALGAAAIACVAAGVFAVAYDLAHYIAPVAPWIVVLCAAGLRTLAAWRPMRASRRGLAVAVAVLGLLAGECVVRGVRRARPPDSFELQRARIEGELANRERKALVVVSYGPGHRVHDDWVFNRADVESARVVWARDQGSAAREKLRECYSGRDGFLLHVDASGSSRLEPLWR